MIVARRGEGGGLPDFRGRRFAINSDDSLSGYVALRVAMREAGLDPDSAEWVETGSHRASIRAVAAGEADIASIDAVCWALAKDYERRGRRQTCGSHAHKRCAPACPSSPRATARRTKSPQSAQQSGTRSPIPASEAPRAALHLADVAIVAEADYAPLTELMRN